MQLLLASVRYAMRNATTPYNAIFLYFSVASGPSSAASGQSSNANHVLLKDVGHLVQQNVVGVPSGFTKLGHPLLYFPDDPEGQNGLLTMSEADLHLLFKYYLAVVPRAEQAPGFALIIDRRLADYSTNVRMTFQKIVTLFPGLFDFFKN